MSRSNIPEEGGGSAERVAALLVRFKYLEAAGACEAIASAPVPLAERSPKWWKTTGHLARAYWRYLVDTPELDAGALKRTLRVDEDFEGAAELRDEVNRLANVVDEWSAHELGEAYFAFVRAFAAAEAFDGKLAMSQLANSLELSEVSAPLDPHAEQCLRFVKGETARGTIAVLGVISGYEALQLVADHLADRLELGDHPFSHMRTFTLLPRGLRRLQ